MAGPQPHAIDRLIDMADAVTGRLRIPLSVLSVVWFALTCADYAGFAGLPEFALIDGLTGLIASGLFNALWWGFLYPRAEQRRTDRVAVPTQVKTNANG